MGRPENAIDFTVPARGKLALLLREVRYEAGLTYDELAVRTARSPATLKRACGGKKVPEEKVVVDIIQECVGTRRVAEGRRAWKQARMADRGRYDRDVGHTRPDLHCSNRRELTIGLANLYESAGAPPLDALVERAGGTWVLPRSSAAAIINRNMLPVSIQQLIAYLKGCGVPTRVHNQWIYAWVLHGGRGHQRSTKAGKSSVTQNLTADLADIIQTGTIDQEKLNSILRNLIVLMPDPATHTRSLRMGIQTGVASEHELLSVTTQMVGVGVDAKELRRARRRRSGSLFMDAL
ncbi:helix-turn-helix domain-containing protein [Streptomyces hydrogenans]|uniref:helix-turn-helix domain-containing protein n=1 Tax=Streptomyces hydrogenans TaxID=1873719 RepID=UPI0038233FBE